MTYLNRGIVNNYISHRFLVSDMPLPLELLLGLMIQMLRSPSMANWGFFYARMANSAKAREKVGLVSQIFWSFLDV